MTINAKPIIAWDNLLMASGVTLSVTTEALGFSKENLQDWRNYLAWKGTGTSEQTITLDAGSGDTIKASCLGLSGHDLFTQGVTNLALKYSDGFGWTDCFTPFTPASDKTLLKTFAEQEHRYFKLVIPTGYTAAPSIGVLFIGSYLQFPAWPAGKIDPDHYKPETLGSISRLGHYLGGVSNFAERKFALNFDDLAGSWVAANWDPFFEAHALEPFLLAVEIEVHPEWTFYVFLDDPEHSVLLGPNSSSLGFKVKGPKE